VAAATEADHFEQLPVQLSARSFRLQLQEQPHSRLPLTFTPDGCAEMFNEVTAWVMWGAGTLRNNHLFALRVLLLTAIFLFGYLESATWGKGVVACATWFTGLVALVVWIAYPLTITRISAGTIVFLSGLVLLTLYYKRWARKTRSSGPL
jgi:fumarate reductase subunit D